MGGRLTQLDLEIANTEPNQRRLHSVHDTGLLLDERLTFPMRTPGIFLHKGRDCHHTAVLWLAAQPAENGAHQQRRVETVGLRAPLLPRYRNTGRVDDIGLYPSSAEPAREPEPVITGLECHHDPVDRVTGLYRFIPPSSQERQETVRVGLLLL